MIKSIQNISFNGIYDFTFPKNTPDGVIQRKVDATNLAISKRYHVKDPIRSGIQVVPFGKETMRIVTQNDSPYMLTWLFKEIGGEKLAQQYIQRNVQEYHLNVQI